MAASPAQLLVVVTLAVAASCVWASSPDDDAWQLAHSAALASGWHRRGPANANAIVEFTLSLHPRTPVSELDTLLYKVSDPRSPDYGQHLSQARLAELTSASPGDVAAVQRWVASRCTSCAVGSLSAHGDAINLRGKARHVAALLGVPLHAFVAARGPRGLPASKIAAEQRPSLPGAPEVVALATGVALTPLESGRQSRTAGRAAAEAAAAAAAATAAATATAAPGGASSTNLPIPMTGEAADGWLYILVLPRCRNGSFATDPKNLCGGDLTYFDLQVNSSALPEPRVTPEPAKAAQCVPAVFFPAVFCTVLAKHSMTDNIMNYISMRSVFADGTSTAWAYYQGLTPTVWVSPEDLYQLYNVPPGTSVQSPAVSQSMVQFSGASFQYSDLVDFCKGFDLPLPNVTVVGVNNPSRINYEPQLDMQMLAGVGRGAHTWAWINQQGASGEGFIQWASAVNNASDIPMVFSVSYGVPASTVTAEQRNRIDYELMKLGLRGVTVTIATGDSGVQVTATEPSCTHYTTTALATSPYAIAVGGTTLWYNGDQIGIQADKGMYYTASGGFSWHRNRPAHQNEAVEQYLARAGKAGTLPPASVFNASGRAVPDVSAIALNAWTIYDGARQPTGGTSTASPIFAGIVSLLNDARVQVGKSSLGFISPLLYQHPEAFQPISVGNNRCSTWAQCCPHGFTASAAPAGSGEASWSPIGGLGTPRYDVLLAIALALP